MALRQTVKEGGLPQQQEQERKRAEDAYFQGELMWNTGRLLVP